MRNKTGRFGKQAREKASQSETQEKSDNLIKPVEAYIVMLHLVSQKSGQFTDIQVLCFWQQWKHSEAIRVMAHINDRLSELSNEWGEDIPHINAFMFVGDGTCSAHVCEHIFKVPKGEQPTPRQIAEHAKAIYTYPKWDKVLAVFRKEALEPESSDA